MDNYALVRQYEEKTPYFSFYMDTYVVLNPHWNARLSTLEGYQAFEYWAMEEFACNYGCVELKKSLKSGRYYFRIVY